MTGSYPARFTAWGKQLLRYAYLCRLNHPTDLALFLFPALWASLLATDGSPDWSQLVSLLLAAALIRCAAWVYNDWMEARLLPEAPESWLKRGEIRLREEQYLLAALFVAALLLLLLLPAKLFFYALPVPLLLGAYPFVKTRTLLTQPYLALCYTWLVPMAYAAQGAVPGKSAWLLFTATLLWSTVFTTLHALPRRELEQQLGIRSLAQLFDANSWGFIMAMQLGAIFTLWLISGQMKLGIFFDLGLIVTALLIPYQLWLLFSHPTDGAMRSYHSQIWSGIAILCGIAFHYICVS